MLDAASVAAPATTETPGANHVAEPENHYRSTHTVIPDEATQSVIDGLAATLRHHAASIDRHLHGFLMALSAFERTRGWKLHGARCLSQWMAANCAIGLVTARQYIHVAVALRELPLISTAFGEGRIGYSKVRALVRIATPDNEQELLRLAEKLPVHVLEQEIARMRTRKDRNDIVQADSENQRARHQFGKRRCHVGWRADDMLDVKALLTPEQGARFQKVLNLIVEQLAAEEKRRPLAAEATAPGMASTLRVCPETGVALPDEPVYGPGGERLTGGENMQRAVNDQAGVSTRAQRLADALMVMADAWTDSLGAKRMGDRYQVMLNVDAELLPEPEPEPEPELELELELELEPEPERQTMDHADENGSDENGSREPSKAGFRDSHHASAPENGSREPQSACFCEHGHTADARHDDACHEAWLSPGVSVGRETARRLCCDAHIIPLLHRSGEPLKIGRKSPTVPPSLHRAVTARARYRCEFPGCGCEQGLEAHHIVHWADGGPTDIDNLMLLCHYHHTLVHEGRYGIEPVEPTESVAAVTRKDTGFARIVRRVLFAVNADDERRRFRVTGPDGWPLPV